MYKQNSIILGCICALGCEVIYGLSYIFTKHATEIAGALALLGWRFFVAFIVMSFCVLAGFIKINLRGKSVSSLLVIAIFTPCIYFLVETIGIGNTTASESGTFLACIPVASLLASTIILKKKPSKTQILGIFITLIGVLMTVFAVGVSSSLSIIGYMCLITAVVSYALYSVFVDKASAFTGAEITYIMLALGAAFFVILALGEAVIKNDIAGLVQLPVVNRGFLITILYQGIASSVAAFFLSNIAIAKIGVNRTASFIGVATVVSIVAGAAILKEKFSLYQIMGAVVILVGVYVANMSFLDKKFAGGMINGK